MKIESLVPLSEATAYILLALGEERHGYVIMQVVEVLSGGSVSIGPGTLYGALSTMEAQKLVEQTRTEGRRKYYRRLPAGDEILAMQTGRYQRFLDACVQEAARQAQAWTEGGRHEDT
ncbi:MAG: PadR family transcriptional regulator [Spirochaetes bacterium]|nr:PadR family transcriptional regulator [Spirochaetota bacterium]